MGKAGIYLYRKWKTLIFPYPHSDDLGPQGPKLETLYYTARRLELSS